MEPSLFLDLVEKWFPRLVLSVTREINGEDREDPLYFPRFLSRRFSLSGQWDAIHQVSSRVMADVIAMDSSIPLKRREAISSAKGEIPKLAMEMQLNETQLTNLLTMQSSSLFTEQQLIAELFRDLASCIRGQYERLDYLFLKGLSSGVVEVDNTDNVGIGVRLDYQYPAANQFTSSLPWTNPLATPFTDLQPLLAKARLDGNRIRRIMLDRATWQGILDTDQAKQIYAEALGIVTGAPASLIMEDRFNQIVQSNYGFVFEIVERTCVYQINGEDTAVDPWEAGQVIALNNTNLGALVWAFLAEAQRPVSGITYQTVDQFILASQYHLRRPSYSEVTSSQSRAVPVIAAVNQIYKLDSTQTATT